ncbi:MMPL family transporter [Streptomyces coeruleorubidus]|uniref:MMPL family transporter n=1 Tax=Streptomyces coeruleorubidus TaxID=116188 RepID=UPI003688C340
MTITASYGVVVAVFQWGWGGSALGVNDTVPIESYVPMMMFAIIFGLSMDYEIFLLSGRRRAHRRHRRARAHGGGRDDVAGSARLVGSAMAGEGAAARRRRGATGLGGGGGVSGAPGGPGRRCRPTRSGCAGRPG